MCDSEEIAGDRVSPRTRQHASVCRRHLDGVRFERPAYCGGVCACSGSCMCGRSRRPPAAFPSTKRTREPCPDVFARERSEASPEAVHKADARAVVPSSEMVRPALPAPQRTASSASDLRDDAGSSSGRMRQNREPSSDETAAASRDHRPIGPGRAPAASWESVPASAAPQHLRRSAHGVVDAAEAWAVLGATAGRAQDVAMNASVLEYGENLLGGRPRGRRIVWETNLLRTIDLSPAASAEGTPCRSVRRQANGGLKRLFAGFRGRPNPR